MTTIEEIRVNNVVGALVRLIREVESLSTTGRECFTAQIETVKLVFESGIKPDITGSPEEYELERMFRAMEEFCLLDSLEWNRLRKARKQAIDVLRGTTELVARRLIKSLLENNSIYAEK